MKSVALALDIGGSFIKAACVDLKGCILFEQSFSSGPKDTNTKFLKHLFEIIEALRNFCAEKKLQILGLGLGVPGIVNAQKGIVYQSPHFSQWKNFKIRAALQKKIPFPIDMDNDANRAALGEAWLGKGKALRNFIFLTLGTGIGGGIVLNKRIWQGDSGFAGELGHLVIDRNGRSCPCGGQGCLERYASLVGLQEAWRRVSKAPFPGPQELYLRAMKKDKAALEVWKQFGNSLGLGLASLMNVLGIENIILGGGISEAFAVFEKAMKQGMQQHLYQTSFKKMRVYPSQLKNKAGILGCAYAVFFVNQ
ncbi:MAG: ROK family protein [Deltaproteobacteria bacterium]|nr:ROK family protein [Deltaproteobacteria bacterium]